MRIAVLRLLMLAGCCSVAFAANAQFRNSGTINYRYSEKIDQATNVSPLGDDLFGDSTDYENGVTTFSITDVKAASNVRIPVQIGRKFDVLQGSSWAGSQYTVKPDIFGRFWSADVPYIKNDSLKATGWTADSGIGGSTGRCSSGNFSISVTNTSDVIVPAHNFFFGNDINIPGYGKERLLALLSDGARPTDGAAYVGTTKSNWKISCLSSIKNGSGEGFVVTLPDGAKYYFDWLATADTGYLNTDRGTLYLQQNRLYATKAVDRFGGTVTYTYDPLNPHRIVQIATSDGVVISVTYASNGKVETISLGSRTWHYYYNDYVGDWDYLTTVTLPDSSKWTYSEPPGGVDSTTGSFPCYFTPGTRTSSQSPSAGEAATYHMTHPSGAVGDFSFRAIMFGYNRVGGSCMPGTDYVPKAHIGNALYAKAISGLGLQTKTWSINYFPSWSYASECANTSCPTTANTVVTETSGRTTTYVFGNDWPSNASQLLSKTVSGEGVSYTEKYTYWTTVSGQPFPSAVGTDKYQLSSNPLATANRPIVSKVITQDGQQFSMSIESFDSFARPTRIKRSSAPAP